jgi:hypothetical protein
MGNARAGVLGTEAQAHAGPGANSSLDVFGGGDPPGVLGVDDPIPLDTARIIALVDKDWVPSPTLNPDPPITARGATLAQAANDLDAQGEWGQGGGILRTDEVPVDTTTNVTVKLHGNFVYRLPTWTGYAAASPAAKAEWDKMIGKLRAHEDRHLAIAMEEGDRLAKELVGKEIGRIPAMVTAANARMNTRQKELDRVTESGSKPGVQYGDVGLDITIK